MIDAVTSVTNGIHVRSVLDNDRVSVAFVIAKPKDEARAAQVN